VVALITIILREQPAIGYSYRFVIEFQLYCHVITVISINLRLLLLRHVAALLLRSHSTLSVHYNPALGMSLDLEHLFFHQLIARNGYKQVSCDKNLSM
jgi:hypothetical protein